jgi:seipin
MIVQPKTAGRAVLGSVFVLATATLLWSIAVGAYIIFYLSYIPVRGFTLPLYFQFEQGHNLYTSVRLPNGRLVSGQPYDVKVHLHLPRTPANTAAGNFMLDLQLLAPPSSIMTKAAALPNVVASARRPAILTYYSSGIENVHNFISLPMYVLGWRKESERLQVPLIEGIEFSRGWLNLPTDARLEIVSPHHLQVYNAQISFKTRLKGLRYVSVMGS